MTKSPEEIEEISVRTKIIEALGKYGKNFTKESRESITNFMLSRRETLHLHPPTIAGAIFLMVWSKGVGINFTSIFKDVTQDMWIDDEMHTSASINKARIERVNETLNNIVPTNLSPAKLVTIRIGTKADLIRYISFIENKVKIVISKFG